MALKERIRNGLVTLLLQPENSLLNMLLLDEPELGLHPYASHNAANLTGVGGATPA